MINFAINNKPEELNRFDIKLCKNGHIIENFGNYKTSRECNCTWNRYINNPMSLCFECIGKIRYICLSINMHYDIDNYTIITSDNNIFTIKEFVKAVRSGIIKTNFIEIRNKE